MNAPNKNRFQCPICGYDALTDEPKQGEICPSCGTQFDSEGFDLEPHELRADWIGRGMSWFSRGRAKPKDWSPYRQMIIADHVEDLIAHPRFRNELDYRSEVNKAFSEVFISKQLKALRERKEETLTQTQLADKAGMKQSRISELEGMNYSSWSINTLERLAKALGVAFTYSFEAWRDLVSRIQQGLSAEVLAVPSFEHDVALTNQGVFIKQEPPVVSHAYDRAAEIAYTSARLQPFQRWQVDDVVRAALIAAESSYLEEIVQDFINPTIEDEELSDPASFTVFQRTSGPANITSLAIN